MKDHKIKIQVDGVEKWVDALVWFSWVSKSIKSDIEKRRIDFIANVVSQAKEKGIETDIVTRFCDYWTETNPNGKKMRFEMEKTFSVGGRLATFVKNKREWAANSQQTVSSDKQVEERYKKQQEYYKKAEQNYANEDEIKDILLKGKK